MAGSVELRSQGLSLLSGNEAGVCSPTLSTVFSAHYSNDFNVRLKCNLLLEAILSCERYERERELTLIAT